MRLQESEKGQSNRPPGVLVVTQNYLPFIGGIETHVQQIAHEFRRRGAEVAITAMNFAPSRLGPKLSVLHTDLLAAPFEDYQDGPIPVRSLAPRKRSERLRLLPMAVRATPVLRRHAYNELTRVAYGAYRRVLVPKLVRQMANVDVVHCMAGSLLGWAAYEAAQRTKKPIVCTPFVHPKQWGDGPDDVRYYQRCDAVIGLVDTDTAYLESIGVKPDRLQVIGVSPDLPATVDAASFRKRHGFPDAIPIVVYIGRMTAHKGAASILAATERVWKTVPNAQFVFIGPPSAESAEWFPENGDARIHYLGKVSSQEKGDALAACDIFCMPSVSEILPTVYLEAWSLGKPVVGGTARGLRELVEGNGGGFTVAPEGDAVADALVTLLKDPEKRAEMGARGRSLVEAKYSVTGVCDQLETLYRSVIAARAAKETAL